MEIQMPEWADIDGHFAFDWNGWGIGVCGVGVCGDTGDIWEPEPGERVSAWQREVAAIEFP